MPRRTPLNHDQHEDAKTKFLASFRVSGNVKSSAEAAGVSRFAVYNWKRDEPEFAALWDEAEEDSQDVLRAEIKRRAVDGYDEVQTVTDGKGNVKTVTTTRKYSDAILRLLAQARLPEYKPSVDITTAGNPIDFSEAINDPDAIDIAAELLVRLAGYGTDASGSRVHSLESEVAASATPATAE